MSIDLQAIAGRGRTIIDALLATSGTLVTFSRDPDDLDETVNLTTLAITDATPPVTVAANVPVLVVVDGNPEQPVGPAREQAPTTVTFIAAISLTGVAVDDLATVNTAPDTQLVGAQLRVLAVADDGVGVARRITARRI